MIMPVRVSLRLLRPLFRLVATARSDELFIATAVFVEEGVAVEAGAARVFAIRILGFLVVEKDAFLEAAEIALTQRDPVPR